MPTGQANRASVLTSACLRASGASPLHSANFPPQAKRPKAVAKCLGESTEPCGPSQLIQSTINPFSILSRARSSKRTVRLISGVALDECLDPERYRTRAPLNKCTRENAEFWFSLLLRWDWTGLSNNNSNPTTSLQKAAEENRCFSAIDLSSRHGHHQFLPFEAIGLWLDSIQA